MDSLERKLTIVAIILLASWVCIVAFAIKTDMEQRRMEVIEKAKEQ